MTTYVSDHSYKVFSSFLCMIIGKMFEVHYFLYKTAKIV